MQNILIIPQYSMRTHAEPAKWLLNKDANIKLLYLFSEQFKGNKLFLIPEKKYWNEENIKYKIIYEEMKWGKNAYESRIFFDIVKFNEIISKFKANIVLNAIIEFSMVIKDLLPNSIIYSFIHYLDFYLKNNSMCIRQVDGMKYSDKIYFNSETNKNDFFNHISKYFNKNFVKYLINKSFILNTWYNKHEINLKKQEKFNKYTILYPTRLADNARTNYINALNYLKKIALKYKDINVIFTNPTNEIINYKFPANMFELNTDDIISLAWKTHACLVSYNIKKWPSVGIKEIQACNNKLIYINDKTIF